MTITKGNIRLTSEIEAKLASHPAFGPVLEWYGEPKVKLPFHPGFLLDDSPREAEMSETLFWALMAGARGEQNSAFQYVVTTSTHAPAEFQPFVWLELNTRNIEGPCSARGSVRRSNRLRYELSVSPPAQAKAVRSFKVPAPLGVDGWDNPNNESC